MPFFMQINRIASLFAVALGFAAAVAHADQNLSDNFTVPIGQDSVFPNSQGTGPDWSVRSGSGQLTIGVTQSGADVLPASLWDPGPGFTTGYSAVPAGDFVATLTIDISSDVSGDAGFFFADGSGYFGIGVAPWGVGASDSLQINANAPPITSGTFQLIRAGDTFTEQYETTGSSRFSTLVSFSNPDVEGIGSLSLGDSLNGNPGSFPNAVSFSNFSLVSSVPDDSATVTLLGGALAGLAMLRRRFVK
jgi:hypothetical protein